MTMELAKMTLEQMKACHYDLSRDISTLNRAIAAKEAEESRKDKASE